MPNWLQTILRRPEKPTKAKPDPDLARLKAKQREIFDRVSILGVEVDVVRRKHARTPER